MAEPRGASVTAVATPPAPAGAAQLDPGVAAQVQLVKLSPSGSGSLTGNPVTVSASLLLVTTSV